MSKTDATVLCRWLHVLLTISTRVLNAPINAHLVSDWIVFNTIEYELVGAFIELTGATVVNLHPHPILHEISLAFVLSTRTQSVLIRGQWGICRAAIAPAKPHVKLMASITHSSRAPIEPWRGAPWWINASTTRDLTRIWIRRTRRTTRTGGTAFHKVSTIYFSQVSCVNSFQATCKRRVM